jgi:hypothetical protein
MVFLFLHLQDLVMIEEADDGFLIAPLWDAEDGVCEVMMFRIHEADHLGKGLQSSKSVITGPDNVFALLLEILEEDWIGMGGRISPESVDGLARNTHSAELPFSQDILALTPPFFYIKWRHVRQNYILPKGQILFLVRSPVHGEIHLGAKGVSLGPVRRSLEGLHLHQTDRST